MHAYRSLKERWLDEHGGRTAHEDLKKDDKAEYVWMYGGDGHTVKVHLPDEDGLYRLYGLPRRERP